MTAWVIRAGKKGEQEGIARTEGCAVIGYTSGDFPIGDLTRFNSLEQLKEVVCESYGRESGVQKAPQMWAFAREVGDGDKVVLPLKKQRGMFIFGGVFGVYHYADCDDERARHRRVVRWGSPIPRGCLSKQAHEALNVRRTVYRLDGNVAAEICRVAKTA